MPAVSPLALQYFSPKLETISSIKILSASWLMVHEYYKKLTHGIPLDLFEDYNTETNGTHPLSNWELCTLQQGRAKYVGVAEKVQLIFDQFCSEKLWCPLKFKLVCHWRGKTQRSAFLTNKSLISYFRKQTKGIAWKGICRTIKLSSVFLLNSVIYFLARMNISFKSNLIQTNNFHSPCITITTKLFYYTRTQLKEFEHLSLFCCRKLYWTS